MLLFGAKSRFKPVPGGRSLERHCDECGAPRTFIECEVTDKLHVFFVSIVEGTQRRLVCTECSEDVELEPEATRQRPRAAEPAKKPISEREKDEMLAALKRKMSQK